MSLIKEQVFSKVDDSDIKNDVMNSPIWGEAKHLEDVKKGDRGYVYTILFDGPTPINCTSVKNR